MFIFSLALLLLSLSVQFLNLFLELYLLTFVPRNSYNLKKGISLSKIRKYISISLVSFTSPLAKEPKIPRISDFVFFFKVWFQVV